jgi:molybdopterin converting factor small subunit
VNVSGNSGQAGRVDINFFGGELVPRLPKTVQLEISEPITAAELVARLGEFTGAGDLRASIERFYAILLDGTSIYHLQGWSTLVRPGAVVAIVAPMGGGLTATL